MIHIKVYGRQKRKRLGDKILYFLIRQQNREKIHVKIIHVFKLISTYSDNVRVLCVNMPV